MSTIAEMLPQIKTRSQDFTWLARHAETLYDCIKRGLNFPRYVNDAMEALILTFPYLLTRGDLNRWSPLLHDALTNAQLLQDNELQMQIWTRLGDSYLNYARYKPASAAFTTALVRAEEEQALEVMLAAYIGLLRVQVIHHSHRFTHEFVQSVLSLAKQTDDLSLRATLHQTLALAYTHRRETEQALGHGQIAYLYWYKLDDPLGLAQTARIIAKTYRALEQFKLASLFLSLAQDYLSKTEHNFQYAQAAYEQGALYVVQRKFEQAEQWLKVALKEYSHFDKPYSLAIVHHALALAQIGLQQFEQAEDNLEIALRIWQELDNSFEQANVYHALGFMEGKRGNPAQAQEWFLLGLEMCQNIPPMPARDQLIRRIQQTIVEFRC